MRGLRISLTGAALLLLHAVSVISADAGLKEVTWRDVSSGIRDADLQGVVSDPKNESIVYTHSSDVLYRTVDGGVTWTEVLSLRGTGARIHAIVIAQSDDKAVLAGTSEGLYRSDDMGVHWRTIFRGIGEVRSAVLSVAVHPGDTEVIWIGTMSGVFRTQNSGSEWTPGKGIPSGTGVRAVAIDGMDPRIIYAATDRGMFTSTDSGYVWQRVPVPDLSGKEEQVSEDGVTVFQEVGGTGPLTHAVSIDPFDNRTIYLGSASGLYVSQDRGRTWKAAERSGMPEDIRSIAFDPVEKGHIIAATGGGVFVYSRSSGRWDELYRGMLSDDIMSISVSRNKESGAAIVWAATGNGLYRADDLARTQTGDGSVQMDHVLAGFEQEPSIGDIRNAAIEYADVHPDKIRTWKRAAAVKALLPSVRFEYQKNKDWQRGTYFYSNSTEKYTDDDITLDRDKAWSVALTWDLADLIWNNEQTAIDSRSKLLVELRDDILNEVTRLYFERRRLQIDLLVSPPESMKDRIDKDLRLQELTADIDSLTGSYLSGRLSGLHVNEKD